MRSLRHNSALKGMVSAIGLLVVLLVPSRARAFKLGLGPLSGQAVLLGPLIGFVPYHHKFASPSLLLGAELSFVNYSIDGLELLPAGYDPKAVGVYVDGLWDQSADATRLSIGPEVAWTFVGVDLGYMMQRRGGEVAHGASARLFFSLVVPCVYVRGAMLFTGERDAFMELGVLLKLPFLL